MRFTALRGRITRIPRMADKLISKKSKPYSTTLLQNKNQIKVCGNV